MGLAHRILAQTSVYSSKPRLLSLSKPCSILLTLEEIHLCRSVPCCTVSNELHSSKCQRLSPTAVSQRIPSQTSLWGLLLWRESVRVPGIPAPGSAAGGACWDVGKGLARSRVGEALLQLSNARQAAGAGSQQIWLLGATISNSSWAICLGCLPKGL